MTDRELLEMAAKAAGLELVLWQPDGSPHAIYQNDTVSWRWNPLADDGDALRLAVKLGICIYPPFPAIDGNLAIAHTKHMTEERCGHDAYSSTRRAIVRAAATGGRN